MTVVSEIPWRWWRCFVVFSIDLAHFPSEEGGHTRESNPEYIFVQRLGCIEPKWARKQEILFLPRAFVFASSIFFPLEKFDRLSHASRGQHFRVEVTICQYELGL